MYPMNSDAFEEIMTSVGVFISSGVNEKEKAENLKAKKDLADAVKTGTVEDIANILIKYPFKSTKSVDETKVKTYMQNSKRYSNANYFISAYGGGRPEPVRELAVEIAGDLKQARNLKLMDMGLRELLKADSYPKIHVNTESYPGLKQSAMFHGYRSTTEYVINEANKAYNACKNGKESGLANLKKYLLVLGIVPDKVNAVVAAAAIMVRKRSLSAPTPLPSSPQMGEAIRRRVLSSPPSLSAAKLPSSQKRQSWQHIAPTKPLPKLPPNPKEGLRSKSATPSFRRP